MPSTVHTRMVTPLDVICSLPSLPQALEVPPGEKMRVVADLIASENPTRALLFMPSKGIGRLKHHLTLGEYFLLIFSVLTYSMATQLVHLGFKAASLNSDMSQVLCSAI